MRFKVYGGEDMKIGIGYDVHKLDNNRRLVIGGVNIPFKKGLLGHSDADVLVHSIIDAIIGALGAGDIGKLFPSTDEKFKDADSILLLREVYYAMRADGYVIGNLDSVIIAQKPKMSPHIECMKDRIAKALKTSVDNINIKATTEEGLGFTGREEGIASQSVVLLIKKNINDKKELL